MGRRTAAAGTLRFSVQQLEAFLQVSRSGSLSEAARTLGVSQPALSRMIQRMEELAAETLIDRSSRQMRLTPTGHELRLIAERLVADFANAFGELSNFVAGRRGSVTVSALPSIAAVLLPGAIARLKRQAPEIDVLIRDSLSESVVDAVSSGRADLGITVRTAPERHLSYRQLVTDRFGVVCRADDPLAHADTVPWSVFEDRPFVAMSPGSSVRAMTNAAILQAGLSVRPLYECAFLATTGGLVAAGLGITALPRLTLPLVGAPGLVWRPLVRPRIDRSLGVLTRAGVASSPAGAGLLTELLAEARLLRSPA